MRHKTKRTNGTFRTLSYSGQKRSESWNHSHTRPHYAILPHSLWSTTRAHSTRSTAPGTRPYPSTQRMPIVVPQMNCFIAPKMSHLRESLVAPGKKSTALLGSRVKSSSSSKCQVAMIHSCDVEQPSVLEAKTDLPQKKGTPGRQNNLKPNACESNELLVIMRLEHLWRLLQQNLAKAPGSHPPPSLG